MKQSEPLLKLLVTPNVRAPITRYVLLRLAFRVWSGADIDVGSQALASAFGVSMGKFIGAKNELISAGVLLETAEQTKERRRPKLILGWAPEFSSEQVRKVVSDCRYTEAIHSLLKLRGLDSTSVTRADIDAGGSAGRMLEAKRAQKISVESCLLLAVLWLHADEFGVVEKVGAKELAAVTGLDKDSIKYRVGRLRQDELVRSVYPGGYSALLGGRISTTYLLNSKHPYLAKAKGLPKCLDMSNCLAPALGTTFWPWSYSEHKELITLWSRTHGDFLTTALERYHWVLYLTKDEVFFTHLPHYLARYVVKFMGQGKDTESLTRREVCHLVGQEVLRDFHRPRKSDGKRWSRLIKKLGWEPAPEPVLELVIGQDADGNEVVEDHTDLKAVLANNVLFILAKLKELSVFGNELSKVDWMRSRLVWLTSAIGNEGFVILTSSIE